MLCLCIPVCLCVPCCLVGSIPLGNIGWLPGTPSPYRRKRINHQHYHHCHTDTVLYYYPQFSLPPAGVSVALTWLGNLSGGLGPPGYRGDMNGWKKQHKHRLKIVSIPILNIQRTCIKLSQKQKQWTSYMAHYGTFSHSPKQETNQNYCLRRLLSFGLIFH